MRSNKKGVIWVSTVIYVMIAIVVMVIVLEAGLPLIKGITEKSAFNKIRDTLVLLDKQIQQVASEGQGSQRVIPIEITDGELSVKNQKLRWKLETGTQLIDSRTRTELGNLVIASGVDVDAELVADYFIVQNSRIKINFSKIGSSSNFTRINTSTIINNIFFKDSNVQTNGTFTFFVNDSSSINGTGYTSLEDEGTSLTSASVKAHVNNSLVEYDLILTLDSKTDFFRAAIENYKQK
ncbi:hypothetical protein CMO88_03700 [Candidatus Woesearchaeota archaeon]|nr:hypothetical protein [Candidatus Woesearchaeota archaeon]